jgi:hypothetical protein
LKNLTGLLAVIAGMNPSDTHRLALRPHLSVDPAQNSAEHFQNTTLRPILKFQHERILSIFSHRLHKQKVDLGKMDIRERRKYVAQAFQKDVALRNQLVGCVLGLLTQGEWERFVEAEKELSRRLLDLLTQRILSTLE